MSVDVARADVADAAALAALRFRWRTEEAGDSGPSAEAYAAALAEWIEAHRTSHVAYLAKEGGVAIGEAWRATVDRVPGVARPRRFSAFVQAVYVVPEHRGRGVGTDLVGRLVDEARDEGLDYLVVHPSPRSVSFYRRLGFADADRALELRFT
ncbi:MAG TPA: GNAT family N-acetyltransferase [Acidimicrobiales bacterium]|nr:GNAT family N-acetyltransferase [Acidimicrobiales bacterium]